MSSPSTKQVDTVLGALQETFGRALLGVYLHGSAVNGGLRPSSDIDLMAVVGDPVTGGQGARLLSALLRISGRYPAPPGAPRPLEVIVLCRSGLAGSGLPIRAEFLYGEWLRAGLEAGAPAGPVENPDIALVLAQARQRARPLVGPEARALLPEIGAEDIRRAMRAALPALMADLRGDARNVLLTLARMWRTAEMGDFVAKDVAADWAMPRVPVAEAKLLADARAAYLGEGPDDLDARPAEAGRASILLQRRILDLL